MNNDTTDVFRGDRDQLIAEFADSEHRLARELVAVRQLLHLTLGQLHDKIQEYDRQLDLHRRLVAEYRALREAVLRDNRSTEV